MSVVRVNVLQVWDWTHMTTVHSLVLLYEAEFGIKTVRILSGQMSDVQEGLA